MENFFFVQCSHCSRLVTTVFVNMEVQFFPKAMRSYNDDIIIIQVGLALINVSCLF